MFNRYARFIVASHGIWVSISRCDPDNEPFDNPFGELPTFRVYRNISRSSLQRLYSLFPAGYGEIDPSIFYQFCTQWGL